MVLKKISKPFQFILRHYQIKDAMYFKVYNFEVQIYNRALSWHFYGIFLKAHHYNLNHGFWYPQITIIIHKNHSNSCFVSTTYLKWNVEVLLFPKLQPDTAVHEYFLISWSCYTFEVKCPHGCMTVQKTYCFRNMLSTCLMKLWLSLHHKSHSGTEKCVFILSQQVFW